MQSTVLGFFWAWKSVSKGQVQGAERNKRGISYIYVDWSYIWQGWRLDLIEERRFLLWGSWVTPPQLVFSVPSCLRSFHHCFQRHSGEKWQSGTPCIFPAQSWLQKQGAERGKDKSGCKFHWEIYFLFFLLFFFTLIWQLLQLLCRITFYIGQQVSMKSVALP